MNDLAELIEQQLVKFRGAFMLVGHHKCCDHTSSLLNKGSDLPLQFKDLQMEDCDLACREVKSRLLVQDRNQWYKFETYTINGEEIKLEEEKHQTVLNCYLEDESIPLVIPLVQFNNRNALNNNFGGQLKLNERSLKQLDGNGD